MIVTSARYFNILVCHSDVFGIDFQVVWSRHYYKLYGLFISKSLIRPKESY